MWEVWQRSNSFSWDKRTKILISQQQQQQQKQQNEEVCKNRVSFESTNLGIEIDDHQQVSQAFDHLYEKMKENGEILGT